MAYTPRLRNTPSMDPSPPKPWHTPRPGKRGTKPLVANRFNGGRNLLLCTCGTFRKNMYGSLGRLGTEKHTPHDCRHTFSMLCERYGVNENDRKRMLGHSFGSDITNAKYGHRSLEELRAEIEKISHRASSDPPIMPLGPRLHSHNRPYCHNQCIHMPLRRLCPGMRQLSLPTAGMLLSFSSFPVSSLCNSHSGNNLTSHLIIAIPLPPFLSW